MVPINLGMGSRLPSRVVTAPAEMQAKINRLQGLPDSHAASDYANATTKSAADAAFPNYSQMFPYMSQGDLESTYSGIFNNPGFYTPYVQAGGSTLSGDDATRAWALGGPQQLDKYNAMLSQGQADNTRRATDTTMLQSKLSDFLKQQGTLQDAYNSQSGGGIPGGIIPQSDKPDTFMTPGASPMAFGRGIAPQSLAYAPNMPGQANTKANGWGGVFNNNNPWNAG